MTSSLFSFVSPFVLIFFKILFTPLAFRRKGWRRERTDVGSAREYRQWDRESGHNVRENVRLSIRTEVGCDKIAGTCLLPETISQHLPRRSQIWGWRLGLAEKESVPPARAQHLYLRSVGHRCGLCRLYRVLVAMFQTTTPASTTPQAKLKGDRVQCCHFSFIFIPRWTLIPYQKSKSSKQHLCEAMWEVICIWTTLWRQTRGWNGQCM